MLIGVTFKSQRRQDGDSEAQGGEVTHGCQQKGVTLDQLKKG